MNWNFHRPSFYIYYDTQSFIDSKSSSFEEVRSIRSRINSIASIEFISDKYRRNIHIRLSVSFGNNKSSRRVLDAVMSTAGKMRLLDNFRSSCNSILPVPLNSSNITSSIFEPVSVKAVAIIVRLPPFSILRAAPKKRLGLCNALASTPPESTLPEAGETVL